MSTRVSWIGLSTFGLALSAGFAGCVSGEPGDAVPAGLVDDDLIEVESYEPGGDAELVTGLRNEKDRSHLTRADQVPALFPSDGSSGSTGPSAGAVDGDHAVADPSEGAVVPRAGCGTIGSATFCSSPSCLCTAGEGDCDSDAECESTPTLHQCAVDVGLAYGFGALADVCVAVDTCSNTIPGRATFCSTSCLCTAGEGDCDSDAECDTGHLCAVDVGAKYGFGALADVCQAVDTCSNTIPGRATFCSTSCPCAWAEGDCDSDSECAVGFTCLQDVGTTYGFGSLADVCQAPWINEIHYDNTGTDVNEGVEIAGPAGWDLTGWTVVLYNGNGGAPYATNSTIDISTAGTFPNQLNGFGTLWFGLPEDGIQNGSPDGLALVGPQGVVQFLSYEGTFAGVGGPAGGMTSTNIGVSEAPGPVDYSLQLSGSGKGYSDFTWNAPAPHTRGAVNTNQTF